MASSFAINAKEEIKTINEGMKGAQDEDMETGDTEDLIKKLDQIQIVDGGDGEEELKADEGSYSDEDDGLYAGERLE